jgi:hypothetical protein
MPISSSGSGSNTYENTTIKYPIYHQRLPVQQEVNYTSTAFQGYVHSGLILLLEKLRQGQGENTVILSVLPILFLKVYKAIYLLQILLFEF